MGFQQSNGGNSSKFLGRDANTNRMLTGATQTIVLRGNTDGEAAFQAGLVLAGETILHNASSSDGFKYNTSNDYYELRIGRDDTVFAVNMYGESVTITADTFLKGTKVVLSSATFPQVDGTYSLVGTDVSGNVITLQIAPDSPNFVFGDADLSREIADITGTSTSGKINVTVLPFAPAFAVEMLGKDDEDAGSTASRHDPVKFRMSNAAGTDLAAVDYPDGQVVYGEITHFTPEADNDFYAILYCQAKPSLEFSPYNNLANVKLASSLRKGGPVAR